MHHSSFLNRSLGPASSKIYAMPETLCLLETESGNLKSGFCGALECQALESPLGLRSLPASHRWFFPCLHMLKALQASHSTLPIVKGQQDHQDANVRSWRLGSGRQGRIAGVQLDINLVMKALCFTPRPFYATLFPHSWGTIVHPISFF